MKIVYASDLHGRERLYGALWALAEAESANVLILGGDLLPHASNPAQAVAVQSAFVAEVLAPALRACAASVLAIMGNDEWAASIRRVEALEADGLLRWAHGRLLDLGDGYQLVGYGHVPPTPFAIKDFERLDTAGQTAYPQPWRTPHVSQRDGRLVPVELARFFTERPSIEEELARLPQPANYRRAVYVAHSPPFGTRLDVTGRGESVGSKALRAFIETRQPYLTLHGHIHESPRMTGHYLDRLGETLCVNPGQPGDELHAVVFELEDVAGAIRHTVYGRRKPGSSAEPGF